MKFKAILLLFGTMLLLQSCVPSLHPLYTSEVLAWSKDLAGTWLPTDETYTEGSKAETWRFVANKDKSYQLTHYDSEGKPGTFAVHLVKLGKDYFFDLTPRLPTSTEIANDPDFDKKCLSELESFHYYPMHTFAKVIIDKERLSIAMFDAEFLKNLLEQNRIRIKHEKVDGDYVLTASSVELQQFMKKYADDPKAFIDPILLRK